MNNFTKLAQEIRLMKIMRKIFIWLQLLN